MYVSDDGGKQITINTIILIYYNIIIIVALLALFALLLNKNVAHYLAYMSAQLPPMNVTTLYLSSKTVKS